MKNIKLIGYFFFIIMASTIYSSCNNGSQEKVYIVSDRCAKCDGKGKALIKCEHCNGTGTQWSNYDAGNGARVDCIICVEFFCGHNTKSHSNDGKSFSDDCAQHRDKGAIVGQIWGDCNACSGAGRN
jgi:hypothetical protein